MGPAAGVTQPWSRAWDAAAYGDDGFWTTGPGARDGAAAHFRTSVHVGAVLHRALARLVADVDARLGRPGRLDVVDVGAGDGGLLVGLLAALPHDVATRVAAVAVEVRPRPPALDARVSWVQGSAPDAVPDGVRGLLLAHEWLDDVPLDVVEVADDGALRTVLVDAGGGEHLGGAPDEDDLPWLERWWPLQHPGERAEVGRTRDLAWAACVDRLEAGTALAVDYGHLRADRVAGRYAAGTLTGYRAGRVVAPVPDGGANLTAHVALDSLAAQVGATAGSQRDALRALGVDATLPAPDTASSDPRGYADALVLAADSAELVDPSGLGGFGWVRLDR